MKKILSLFICIILLSGCSQAPENSTPVGKATISVYGLENKIIFSSEEDIYDGMTALDLILAVAKENNIPVVFSGNKDSAYITSIDGLSQGQHGDMSGWIYTINEESLMIPCGQYILCPDDIIEFKYITEF